MDALIIIAALIVAFFLLVRVLTPPFRVDFRIQKRVSPRCISKTVGVLGKKHAGGLKKGGAGIDIRGLKRKMRRVSKIERRENNLKLPHIAGIIGNRSDIKLKGTHGIPHADGAPRIFGFCDSVIGRSGGCLDRHRLFNYISEYAACSELTDGEMFAIPDVLEVCVLGYLLEHYFAAAGLAESYGLGITDGKKSRIDLDKLSDSAYVSGVFDGADERGVVDRLVSLNGIDVEDARLKYRRSYACNVGAVSVYSDLLKSVRSITAKDIFVLLERELPAQKKRHSADMIVSAVVSVVFSAVGTVLAAHFFGTIAVLCPLIFFIGAYKISTEAINVIKNYGVKRHSRDFFIDCSPIELYIRDGFNAVSGVRLAATIREKLLSTYLLWEIQSDLLAATALVLAVFGVPGSLFVAAVPTICRLAIALYEFASGELASWKSASLAVGHFFALPAAAVCRVFGVIGGLVGMGEKASHAALFGSMFFQLAIGISGALLSNGASVAVFAGISVFAFVPMFFRNGVFFRERKNSTAPSEISVENNIRYFGGETEYKIGLIDNGEIFCTADNRGEITMREKMRGICAYLIPSFGMCGKTIELSECDGVFVDGACLYRALCDGVEFTAMLTVPPDADCCILRFSAVNGSEKSVRVKFSLKFSSLNDVNKIACNDGCACEIGGLTVATNLLRSDELCENGFACERAADVGGFERTSVYAVLGFASELSTAMRLCDFVTGGDYFELARRSAAAFNVGQNVALAAELRRYGIFTIYDMPLTVYENDTKQLDIDLGLKDYGLSFESAVIVNGDRASSFDREAPPRAEVIDSRTERLRAAEVRRSAVNLAIAETAEENAMLNLPQDLPTMKFNKADISVPDFDDNAVFGGIDSEKVYYLRDIKSGEKVLRLCEGVRSITFFKDGASEFEFCPNVKVRANVYVGDGNAVWSAGGEELDMCTVDSDGSAEYTTGSNGVLLKVVSALNCGAQVFDVRISNRSEKRKFDIMLAVDCDRLYRPTLAGNKVFGFSSKSGGFNLLCSQDIDSRTIYKEGYFRYGKVVRAGKFFSGGTRVGPAISVSAELENGEETALTFAIVPNNAMNELRTEEYALAFARNNGSRGALKLTSADSSLNCAFEFSILGLKNVQANSFDGLSAYYAVKALRFVDDTAAKSMIERAFDHIDSVSGGVALGCSPRAKIDERIVNACFAILCASAFDSESEEKLFPDSSVARAKMKEIALLAAEAAERNRCSDVAACAVIYGTLMCASAKCDRETKKRLRAACGRIRLEVSRSRPNAFSAALCCIFGLRCDKSSLDDIDMSDTCAIHDIESLIFALLYSHAMFVQGENKKAFEAIERAKVFAARDGFYVFTAVPAASALFYSAVSCGLLGLKKRGELYSIEPAVCSVAPQLAFELKGADGTTHADILGGGTGSYCIESDNITYSINLLRPGIFPSVRIRS